MNEEISNKNIDIYIKVHITTKLQIEIMFFFLAKASLKRADLIIIVRNCSF